MSTELTKARNEIDRARKRARRAAKTAKTAPRDAMMTAPIAAAAYGLARGRVAALDGTFGEGLVGGALAAYGVSTGNATAIHAATGILSVAAHNLAQDMGEMFFPADADDDGADE